MIVFVIIIIIIVSDLLLKLSHFSLGCNTRWFHQSELTVD